MSVWHNFVSKEVVTNVEGKIWSEDIFILQYQNNTSLGRFYVQRRAITVTLFFRDAVCRIWSGLNHTYSCWSAVISIIEARSGMRKRKNPSRYAAIDRVVLYVVVKFCQYTQQHILSHCLFSYYFLLPKQRPPNCILSKTWLVVSSFFRFFIRCQKRKAKQHEEDQSSNIQLYTFLRFRKQPP